MNALSNCTNLKRRKFVNRLEQEQTYIHSSYEKENMNENQISIDFRGIRNRILDINLTTSRKNSIKKQKNSKIQEQEVYQQIQEYDDEVYYSDSNEQIYQNEKSKKQATYKMSTTQQKEQFLLKCIEGESPEIAAQQCGLAVKCAKRWIQNLSAERLKGGGRKIVDPILEQKLRLWICLNICVNSKIPSREQQMKYSMENSNDVKFKASKGWLEKYLDRNQLKQVLQEYRRNTPVKLIDIAKFFIIIPDNHSRNYKQLKSNNTEILYKSDIYQQQQQKHLYYSQCPSNQNNQQNIYQSEIKPISNLYDTSNSPLKDRIENFELKMIQNQKKEIMLINSHIQYQELDMKFFINLIERSNSYRRYLLKKEDQPNQLQEDNLVQHQPINNRNEMEIEQALDSMLAQPNDIPSKIEDKAQDLKFTFNVKRPLPIMLRQILNQTIIDERNERIRVQHKLQKQQNLNVQYEIERSLFFEVAVNQLQLNPDELMYIFNFE